MPVKDPLVEARFLHQMRSNSDVKFVNEAGFPPCFLQRMRKVCVVHISGVLASVLIQSRRSVWSAFCSFQHCFPRYFSTDFRSKMPTITENNGSMEPEEEDMDHYENDDRKSSEEETASGSGEGEEDQEEDEDEGGSSGNSNHFIYQPCQIQTDRMYCIVTDLLYFV